MTLNALYLTPQAMPILRPITDYRNNLTELEGNRMTELMSAANVLTITFGKITSQVDTYMDAMTAITRSTEDLVQRLVIMCKTLTAFNTICPNDQIALLKYGSIELCSMRQFTGYDPNTQYLAVHADKETSTLVKFEGIKSERKYLYEAYRQYYQCIHSEWDSDVIILNLLTAIALFNPNRPNLLHRKAIKQNYYETDVELRKCCTQLVKEIMSEEIDDYFPFFITVVIFLQEFSCHFDSKCSVNLKTRKFCRFCRLQKCFDIGMRKGCLLTDNEKDLRRKRLQMKREKLKEIRETKESETIIDSTTTVIKRAADIAFESTSSSSESSQNDITVEEGVICLNHSEFEDIMTDHILEKTSTFMLSVVPVDRPLDGNQTFNELEANKLSELLMASAVLKRPDS
ncbi:unnamed protein product, partial [Oppiella nova]